MSLLADLIDLGHLKERVATYHLFERHAEFVPAVLEVRGKAEPSLREAHERLAYIASRCSRDIETDRMIVPPHLGQENIARLKQRDKAEKDLSRIKKLLGIIAAELRMRISHKRLHGRPGIPKLRLLQPMPEAFVEMAGVLTNAHLAARAAELDAVLRTDFASMAPEPEAEPEPAPEPEAEAHADTDVQHAHASPAELEAVAAAADAQALAGPAEATDTSTAEAYADQEQFSRAEGRSAPDAVAPDADPYAAYPSEHLEGFLIDPSAVRETDDSSVNLGEAAETSRTDAASRI